MVPMDFRSQQDHCGLAYNNNNSSSSTNVQYPFTPNPIRASSSSSFPLKPCNSLPPPPPPPPPHDLFTANTTATADHSAPTSPRAGGAGAITKAGEAEDTAIKHRECLRNHAASVGGYVLDGCCEFMPCDTDPLKCAACNCHRSFHRKHYHHHHHHHQHPNLTGRDRMSVPLLLPPPPPPHHHHHHPNYSYQQKQLFGNSSASFPPSPSGVIPGSSNKSSAAAAAAAMLATTNNSGSGATTESSSEERLILDHGSGTPHAHAHHGHPHQMVVSKKRFRTKFTPEQKEKMLAFADKVGWRFQRQDEAAVEQLCNEIGVSRQVLKVWMHNNKHSLKKQQQQQQQQVLDLEQQLQQQRQQQLIQHPPPPPPQESGTPAAAAAATFGHVGTS